MIAAPGRVTVERLFTQADFERFAELSGDDNPIHVGAAFSARTRFGRTVAHGMLLYTVLRGLIARIVPGGRQVSQEMMFPAPTYADEILRFAAERVSRDGELISVRASVTRVADGVVTCEALTTLRLRPQDVER